MDRLSVRLIKINTVLSFFVVGLVSCETPPVKTVNRNRTSLNPVVETKTVAESEMKLAVATDETSGTTAAQTQATDADPQSSGKPSGKGESGVLIAYQLSGDLSLVSGGGCRLRVENVKTNKHTFITLKKEDTAVYKELDPGRYFGTRLSCATTKIWNLDNLFGMGFDVQPGRVSYVGKVMFDFTKTDLSSFKQAPRLESQKALPDATGAMPIGAAENLVTAFTMKPITPAIISSEGPETFDVYAKGTSDPNKTLEDLMSKLKRCSINVVKDDPLRIGHLTYVATYKAGSFAEMKEKNEAHALSENFTTCVDNSLRTFKPTVSNDLEVRVKY